MPLPLEAWVEECDASLFAGIGFSTFVQESNEVEPQIRARFPLKSASVELTSPPEFPDLFYAVLRIQPHFQTPGRALRIS